MQKCANSKCGNEFEPKSYVHRFCSEHCRKAVRGREFRWAREIALERDSHTCQDCGATNCRLEVHHIQPLCMGGTNKLYNLVTLCVKCHKAIHKSWRMWYGYRPDTVGTDETDRTEATSDRAA